jgi:hypothetical protein
VALSDEELRDILEKYRRVAVYGMSRNPGKAAHDVPAFLSKQGYQIIPVNPNAGTIDGKTSYGSLRDIPETIDILEVFRPSEQVLAVVKEAVERKKARGDIAVVWLQQGIRSEEARKIAEGAGILFVQDRCMKATLKKLTVKGEP